jgi:hypothetical protein
MSAFGEFETPSQAGPGRPLWRVVSIGERNTYLGSRSWSGVNEETISPCRVYRGAERGTVGSLAKRRRAQGDRSGDRQAEFVCLRPSLTQRWDQAAASTTIAAGADLGRARRDFAQSCSWAITSLDSPHAGAPGIDGADPTRPRRREDARRPYARRGRTPGRRCAGREISRCAERLRRAQACVPAK